MSDASPELRRSTSLAISAALGLANNGEATMGTLSEGAARPDIYLFEGTLPKTVEEIEALLAEGDPQICQNNGAVYVDLAGGPVRATAALLRNRAMHLADFYKPVGPPRYGYKLVDPPLKYSQALLHKGEWRFPTLDHGGTGAVG
jgi:hypothetical protein